MTTKRRIGIFAIAVVALIGLASVGAAEPDLGQAAQVDPLEKIHGDGDDIHRPGLAPEGQLRVYWFWAANSPCSKRAEPGIEALIDDYPDVEVVVVHSNLGESADEARRALEERGVTASVYRDDQVGLAIALDAQMTPEVVVVDDEGVLYRGRPVRVRRGQIESYVAQVVQAWKDGEEVEQTYRRPSGCTIARP